MLFVFTPGKFFVVVCFCHMALYLRLYSTGVAALFCLPTELFLSFLALNNNIFFPSKTKQKKGSEVGGLASPLTITLPNCCNLKKDLHW